MDKYHSSSSRLGTYHLKICCVRTEIVARLASSVLGLVSEKNIEWPQFGITKGSQLDCI
jgi:hypothetical protein